jgi:FMN-dependent oxidoreductase (nitrilotriacetate monooxygenase family)
LAAYVAAVTSRIGIVTTVNTTYADPFNVARATANIDHLSGGRLAFNVVTGRNPEAAANFGRAEHWATDRRFDNATEFIEVVKGLWDSWEDDALVADKVGGMFIDPRKVHRLNFKGEHFSVAGPLNIARPPQGQIPLLTAGESERSKEFGAQYADIRFGTALHIDPAKAYYADIKSRLAKFGRPAQDQQLVTGIAVYVGYTAREAHDKYREIQNLSVTNYDLTTLSGALGVDLTRYTLDTPVADIEELASPHDQAARIVEQARSSFGTDKVTVRDVYLYFRRSGGGAEIVGDAKKVADVFQQWFEERAADGFILFPPYLPGTAELFVELVVPELQRRGLLRKEYEGRTFRDHFGLKRPVNRYAAARSAPQSAA